MWNVEYIAINDSPSWSILDPNDNEAKTIKQSAHAADEYLMVKVTHPGGSVIRVN